MLEFFVCAFINNNININKNILVSKLGIKTKLTHFESENGIKNKENTI
jgi:hypothetical protein